MPPIGPPEVPRDYGMWRAGCPAVLRSPIGWYKGVHCWFVRVSTALKCLRTAKQEEKLR